MRHCPPFFFNNYKNAPTGLKRLENKVLERPTFREFDSDGHVSQQTTSENEFQKLFSRSLQRETPVHAASAEMHKPSCILKTDLQLSQVVDHEYIKGFYLFHH